MTTAETLRGLVPEDKPILRAELETLAWRQHGLRSWLVEAGLGVLVAGRELVVEVLPCGTFVRRRAAGEDVVLPRRPR